MPIFGWSYPPGCTETPYDEEPACALCGRRVDACLCPICPICGVQGDPACGRKGAGRKGVREQGGRHEGREAGPPPSPPWFLTPSLPPPCTSYTPDAGRLCRHCAQEPAQHHTDTRCYTRLELEAARRFVRRHGRWPLPQEEPDHA